MVDMTNISGMEYDVNKLNIFRYKLMCIQLHFKCIDLLNEPLIMP